LDQVTRKDASASAGEAEWRNSEREQARIRSLLELAGSGTTALDVGARDGYLSVRLAQFFDSVTALDLERPEFTSARVATVAGDVTALPFPDQSFDCVLCAEVLEHIPTEKLHFACRELARVARKRLIIGVPYREDRRVGKTRCRACSGVNPPWGHVNTFDEAQLRRLFSGLTAAETKLVGSSARRTNAVSSMLMTMAGNPYGTYEQDEPCIHCGAALQRPKRLRLIPRATARLAVSIDRVVAPVGPKWPNWIHVRFERS
jgi:SAM-dependent methyltransferase